MWQKALTSTEKSKKQRDKTKQKTGSENLDSSPIADRLRMVS